MTRIAPAALLAALLLAASPALAQDPAKTVLDACGKCHNVKRICTNLGVKNKGSWRDTVERMVGKGAQVPKAEQSALVEWLAAQPAGAKPVCE